MVIVVKYRLFNGNILIQVWQQMQKQVIAFSGGLPKWQASQVNQSTQGLGMQKAI